MRKSRCSYLARIVLLVIMLAGTAVMAGGPVPPELSSFTPLDQDELVDHFTGDFRYSVPLMEVPGPNGGYPISLTYASGISHDQDASWVGLGWTLSPGAIVRQMRGIPDEFEGIPNGSSVCGTITSAGDTITTTHAIEPNLTFGLSAGAGYEFFGLDAAVGFGVSAALKAYFDSYRGFGISHTIGLSGQAKKNSIAAAVGLNLSEDTLEGGRVGAQASLSLADTMRFSADGSFDPYRGVTALGVGAQYSYQGTNYLNLSADLKSFLGYAKPASLPSTGREMAGSNLQLSFKAGGEVYGNYINAPMSGFYNEEHLACLPSKTTAAFGFLHLDEATEKDAVDFNRERDGPIYDQSPNLAMPVLTNDLFVASGRDVTGTFRAYRNDVPVVYDPLQESNLAGGALGVDVGFGNLIKVGLNGTVNGSSNTIKRWDGGNSNALFNDPRNAYQNDPSGYRERTYFKFIGELTGSPAPTPVDPIRVPLSAAAWSPTQTPPTYFTADAVDLKPPVNDQRVPRSTLVEAFTYNDLSERPDVLAELGISRIADSYRLPNHIAAFRITTPSGLRYIYGSAVYNTKFQEHKFSVDRSRCPQGNWCTTLTDLPARVVDEPSAAAFDYADSSKTTSSEGFLEVKEISPYPTSYLLTAILGPDYIDADGVPGPSDGDYGYWVKFTYERDTQLFKWRTPYAGAAFVRGPENGRYVDGKERLADKGYFTYGERESWYLAAIETATHKAYMCVDKSDRSDAIGAQSLDQQMVPQSGFAKPWRLDSVRLFTKRALPTIIPATCSDLTTRENPLITAQLEYDYSLAKGAADQDPAKGKLTLKKLHFTHLGNTRGSRSPYEFDYKEDDRAFNPVYSDGDHDRWNIYQKRPAPPPNRVAPIDEDLTFTDQKSPDLDTWSSVWNLRRIVEPSGRTINIDYEADDYSYVQDKPAMRMFPIMSVDASRSTPTRICPTNLPTDCGGAKQDKARIYFRLDKGLPCANATECETSSAGVSTRYLGNTNQVFFRERVALRATNVSEKWQTISGYAVPLAAGVERDGSNAMSTIGWIELAAVQGYHPLAHAAWQYLRLEQPELIRDGGINGDPHGDPLNEALGVLTMMDFIPDLITMVQGVYARWSNLGWGQKIDLAHSYIRLQVPDGVKKGGGSRVKRISVSDDWRASTAQTGHDLLTGYEYSYHSEDGRSSGVASYEPMTGGEENPLRVAKPFSDAVMLSSNYNLFAELPIGEAHYPAPNVGYARIVRRTLAAVHDAKARPQHPASIGPTVYEYYTARDFPVRQLETDIDKRQNPAPQRIPIPFLGEITLNSVTASQGYTTISNDMHGKLKRVTSYEYLDSINSTSDDYAVREEPLRETTYNYRRTGGYAGLTADLNNNDVEVLTPYLIDGMTRPPKVRTLAENSDLVVDMRLNQTQSWDAGLNLNVDTFLVGWFPIPIPVPMPNFGYSLTEAKTAVTSRSIHRAGILESVTVRDRSARMTTRNLLYDPLSGKSVLTATDNAFGAPVFHYEIPAHWVYPRMGPAYDELGRATTLVGTVSETAFVPDPFTLNDCGDYPAPTPRLYCFPIGTEFFVPFEGGGLKLTLVRNGNGRTELVKSGGDMQVDPTGKSARVIRSGNRNQLTLVTDVIEGLGHPLKSMPSKCNLSEVRYFSSLITDVLKATHVSYQDTWPDVAADVRFAGRTSAELQQARTNFNARDPYARGERGIYRVLGEYTFVTERSSSRPGVDLSRDGTFTLQMFGGLGTVPCDTKWRMQRLVSHYTASGFSAEEQNSLRVPSSALYGNHSTVVAAVANNAARDEVAAEGFETYNPNERTVTEQTGEGNFQFATVDECIRRWGNPCYDTRRFVTVSSSFAHSGRQSLAVTRNSRFPQNLLKLTPGKRYVLSAWMSRGPAVDVQTYAGGATPIGLRVFYRVPGGWIPSPIFQPAGPIIDGWQKVEAEFSVPDGAIADQPIVGFLTGNPTAAQGEAVYFDDLRILPADAKLESYVYDGVTLRMIASLDENNYATIFGYSPNGRAELLRRETVRGIFAGTEGRLHTRERP